MQKRLHGLAAVFALVAGLVSWAGAALAAEQSPEEVANQAGTVAGTAAVCEVDTAEYDKRVRSLLEHLGSDTVPASKLVSDYDQARTESEQQMRAEPTVDCDDFRGMFPEFLINGPDWTVSQGWRPL